MARALASLAVSPCDRPPTSLKGRSGTTAQDISAAFAAPVGTASLSGAMTASTYKSILTLTAPGVLKLCAVWSVDATARQMSLRIIIDGVTAYDVTLAPTSAASKGVCAVGILNSVQSLAQLDRVPFNTLTVQIRSTLTETDKMQSLIIYDLV